MIVVNQLKIFKVQNIKNLAKIKKCKFNNTKNFALY